jgi:hypothetical protein
MALNFTIIFHCKNFQNLPKIGIFGLKINHLATLENNFSVDISGARICNPTSKRAIARATRCVCEKIVRNLAQHIFSQNYYSTFTVEKVAPKVGLRM